MSRKVVIDPDGSDCHGKYEVTELPDYIPDDEAVEVDDLSNYSVIEWRYEDLSIKN